MADKTTRTRLGPCFWLPTAWITVVMAAALSAGWLPIAAPDRIHWETMAALPGTVGEVCGNGGTACDDSRNLGFLLGTDTMGRDIFSRLVHGARVSLAVGLIAPLMGLVTGGLLGCLAGYYRGRLEAIIIALMDIVLAFPGLILLLAITFYVGASLMTLILALGLLTLPAFCRVARAKTLALIELEFIDAARLTGVGDSTILFREIIPNVIIPVAVYGLMVAAFLIMAEGALSFLGLGVPAPTPSWGGMIAEGKEVLDDTPHISLIPAGIMFVTVLSFNLTGDCIRRMLERQESQL